MKFKWYALLCAIGVMLIARCSDSPQEYRPPILLIETTADSLIAVRDTLHITVTAEGAAGRAIRYCFLRDDSWIIDTLAESRFSPVWQFPDTGLHQIIVWAIDSTVRQSNKDTVTVHVRSYPPEVSISCPDSAVMYDTVVLRAEGTDRDGTIERYEWQVGRRSAGVIATEGDSLAMQWTKEDTGYQTIRLFAIDNDGMRSASDSLTMQVVDAGFGCALSGDTALSINDTGFVVCRIHGAAGRVFEYHWSVGSDTSVWISTQSDIFRKAWPLSDTGRQVVRGRAIDDHGLVSTVDSLTIRVFASSPQTGIEGARRTAINDSARFIAHASDEDGGITGYQWSIETASGTTLETTSDSIIAVVWSLSDTGRRAVGVIAVDDDSLHSSAAVCTISVTIDAPVLAPVNDTALSSLDTLLISRKLADTAQRVESYFWDLGGGGWDDSTEGTEHTVAYTGTSPLIVIVGVRDTGGRFYRDTTTVTFNRPPVIDSLSLVDGDTVWLGEQSIPGTLPLRFLASDADNDGMRIKVGWGRGDAVDTLAGNDSTRLAVDSTGLYRWSITVTDAWGHRIEQSGSVVVGKEHTVCFAGHSIITGVGDTLGTGGFRGGVLAGLRDSVGACERIRAIGPLKSEGMMFAAPADDSCFAISGSFAREMLLLMDYAYKDLTADIWVLMLGVNGSFSDIEMRATASIINRMFSRNPKARVYVLRSPPFTEIPPVQRMYYNDHIYDTVSSWAAKGFAANVVRSDSVLWLETDTLKADNTLFCDNPLLHPNVEGYRLLSNEILRVMWSREPRVFTKQE